MVHISYNQVRMSDTDAAGVLYFAKQFRYAHEAYEDWMESLGYSLRETLDSAPCMFLIVHTQANYYKRLKLGEQLKIHLAVKEVKKHSWALIYEIYKEGVLSGTVETVHVAVDKKTNAKTPLPETLRKSFEKYSVTTREGIHAGIC